MANNAHPQKLKPSLSVFDVVLITASGVTPASSIFVITPLAITTAGSGAFLSFIIAGIMATTIALCYAELGAAHPSAGGEYSIVQNLFGTLCGLQTYLFLLASALFIPAVLANGAIPYLNTAIGTHFNAAIGGMITVLLGSALAILDIKVNAKLTGVFLIVEIAILAFISWLGYGHSHQSIEIFTSPVIVNDQGGLGPVTLPVIVTMVGVALFSFNGYGSAVYMAEDMQQKGKPMARAVMLTLGAVVVIELVPFAALLLGAPSFVEMSRHSDPVSYVVTELGGPTLARILSAAIFLSVFNAIIAIVAQCGRMMYASGRDKFWPALLNNAFTKVHSRFGTPWMATIIYGIPSALLAVCSDLESLTSFTVILLLFIYIFMAIAALISRRRAFDHPYLMPLWPVPAVIALLGCGYVLWTILVASSMYDFIIIAGIVIFGFILSYHHRRQKYHRLPTSGGL